MALRINPDIYNGAAVSLNSDPYTDFAIRTMAQKKAKEEALDEYYKKLPSTINDAGMRDTERPKLTQKIAQAQQFWAQNRDKIKNPKLDDGASQVQLENMYREASQLVEESKQRAKLGLEIGKMRFDPEKQFIFEDPNIIESLKKHDMAIGDEGSEAINLSNMMIPPKPFEVDKFTKKFEKVPRDEKIVKVTSDPKTLKLQIEKEMSFGVPQLQAIYQTAASEYSSNSSFRKFVKDNLDNESKLKELDPVFRQYFKNGSKDPKDGIRDWNDLAAVYTLQLLQPTVKKVDEDDDFVGRQNFQQAQSKELKAIDLANSKALATWKKANGIGEDGTKNGDDGLWIDEHIQEKVAKGKPAFYNNERVKEISLDPILEEALEVNDQRPDFAYEMPDGSIRYGLYERNDKGKIIRDGLKTPVDGDNVRTISKGDLKLAIGKKAGVKQMNKEMSSGTKPNSKIGILD